MLLYRHLKITRWLIGVTITLTRYPCSITIKQLVHVDSSSPLSCLSSLSFEFLLSGWVHTAHLVEKYKCETYAEIQMLMSCLVEISNTVSGGWNALNTKSWSYKQLRWWGLKCKTHKKKTEEGINKENVISVTAVSLVLKNLPF